MIKGLLDKIFFAAGVIVFLQLPHFIDQYTHRMGGYAASQAEQIAEYQSIADQHFDGDLDTYIERLKTNQDPAVIESARQVEKRLDSSTSLLKELQVYEQEPLWYQMPYFFTHMRMDLVRGTARQFTPGLPINLWAWGYGLLGGVLFSLLFNGIVKTPGAVRKKLKQRKSKPKLSTWVISFEQDLSFFIGMAEVIPYNVLNPTFVFIWHTVKGF